MTDKFSLQALVLAAGRGTRMKSTCAKVLHTAFELPLLEHVLRAAGRLTPEPLTVVVGHQAEAVEAAFAGRGLVFVRQEPQLGTGHAVRLAAAQLARQPQRAVLVIYGDMPLLRPETLKTLAETHFAQRAVATLLTCVLDDPGAYGRVVRDEAGHVRRIVEAADATPGERAIREINAGVYVFEVPALERALARLENENAQGELYLTDVIELLSREERLVQALTSDDPSEALGVNTLAELAQASEVLRARRLASLMSAGVVVERPDTVSVGPDAQIAPEAVLRPFTLVEGGSIIEAGARVGPFVRIVNCRVGAQAQILDHCLLRDSSVGPGASVGPFAHVRPESVIGAQARVGNFVELKKTHLGDGSKAPHLSYLGDSTIGPRVNVGAGTITCNYDGARKHPTRIEAGVFVGSNATLVAPLTIGAGAYIGAGSVVTEDVPADALALGRARQVVKTEWAARRRERLAREKG
jgi:bifunctional UDP-N-acetylglucosamine pyrophosphorylase/glucosamine-1-phosphate N-acetyltransferase